MATTGVPVHAAASLLAAAPLPQRRAGRWRPVLLLVALVLAWHAWLAGALAPGAAPAGPLRPGTVHLRSLPAAAPARPAEPAEPADSADSADSAGPAAGRPRPHADVATVAAPPVPALAQAVLPARQAAAMDLQAANAMPGPAPVPAGDADRAPAGAADRGPADGADPGPAGEPPPLYRTQLPPPAQRRYALRLNGQEGEALLVWQHDGQRYRLTLDGQAAGGTPLLSQASEGRVDAHGLAPDRYVDSRRGGRTQAANFRRDIGRIGYSGPPQQHPAWPGAQDRLSWLAQLAAILAAADGPPPDALRLFITDARGHAGLWAWQRQPDTTGATPWGEAPLQHWQREPPRPEGLRVDVWLAVDAAVPAGTPAGAWPVRLRLLVPRSGDVVDLQLLAAP